MNYNYNPQGIGFAGLLTILFIGLRLLQVIDWPWAWVLSPLWISAIIVVVMVIIVLIWQKN
ncbi:MAG: hypothetical protein J6A79_03510 [Clostridia bacterium]|nr:hypothetical protein [Clostridia bacterium]